MDALDRRILAKKTAKELMAKLKAKELAVVGIDQIQAALATALAGEKLGVVELEALTYDTCREVVQLGI